MLDEKLKKYQTIQSTILTNLEMIHGHIRNTADQKLWSVCEEERQEIECKLEILEIGINITPHIYDYMSLISNSASDEEPFEKTKNENELRLYFKAKQDIWNLMLK